MLFVSCKNRKQQPLLDGLLEVMLCIIQKFLEIYILLDALDKYNNRTDLIAILERIAGLELKGLYLLVTSQEERDIKSLLEPLVDLQNTICL
jgi:hypothetical protein